MSGHLPEGWKWATFPLPRDVLTHFDNSILMVSVFSDENDDQIFLGTAFVVGRVADNAFCITASHVMTSAIRSALHPNVPTENIDRRLLPKARHRAISSRRMVLSPWKNPRSNREVIAITMEPALDISIVVIRIPEEDLTKDFHEIPINSDVLEHGTAIIAAGLVKLLPDLNEATSAVIHNDSIFGLNVLAGTVVDVPASTRILKGIPSFTTSIPFSGGMSGGPIFAMPMSEELMPLAAVASISNDFSRRESFKDVQKPGDSSAVPIIFSYVPQLCFDGKLTDMLDFRRNGWIKDLGRYRDSIVVEHLRGIGDFRLTVFPLPDDLRR